MANKSKNMLRNRLNRLKYMEALNKRVENLDLDRVNECKEAIWKSYETSTISPYIANIAKEQEIDFIRFRLIGLWHSIKLDEFMARDYYWKPYFSDVGRAIVRGEKKYLHKRIGRRVTGGGVTISRTEPKFSILTEHINQLARNNRDPNTVIAPIQMFVEFMKFYAPSMNWLHDRPEELIVGDCKLNILWSNKYARLNSFIIFNSEAGIWHNIPDQKTGRPITIAIGKSEKCVGRVEYWVETVVWYQILYSRAFCRINLSE